MSLSRINFTLLVAMLVLLMGAWVMRRDPTQRNLEWMPGMQYSPAYGTYKPNPNFPGDQTLQLQPAGTIARGDFVLRYQPTPEDAVRAGEELIGPLDANDSAGLSRGGELFQIFCVVCHGPQGLGDGPVTKRGCPPPPSLLTGKSVQMKDGQLFHILTYGQGGMASYASQISPADRWHVINHVRSMQAKAQQPPVPPPGEANPEELQLKETPLDNRQPEEPAPSTDVSE